MQIIHSIAELQVILDQAKDHVTGIQEDIDGEFIPEACSDTTWQKATRLILAFYHEIMARGIALELPTLTLAPNGGIDLHVRAAKYDLLLVIYKEKKDAVFSVDNYSPKSIMGYYPAQKEMLFDALQRFVK